MILSTTSSGVSAFSLSLCLISLYFVPLSLCLSPRGRVFCASLCLISFVCSFFCLFFHSFNHSFFLCVSVSFIFIKSLFSLSNLEKGVSFVAPILTQFSWFYHSVSPWKRRICVSFCLISLIFVFFCLTLRRAWPLCLYVRLWFLWILSFSLFLSP